MKRVKYPFRPFRSKVGFEPFVEDSDPPLEFRDPVGGSHINTLRTDVFDIDRFNRTILHFNRDRPGGVPIRFICGSTTW